LSRKFSIRKKAEKGNRAMSGKNVVEFSRGISPTTTETEELVFQPSRRKQPHRVTLAPEDKILVSREEAAQLLSISQRALDYLVASRRLPTRRIGGRVLIPVADLRKYAHCDHPENIVTHASSRRR
jgi:excisionase family DNA binding protein